MRGSRKCKVCRYYVSAEGDVLYGGEVRGLCGWGTVPCAINTEAIDRPGACGLLKRSEVAPGVQPGKGVDVAKLWVEAAHGQLALEQRQFHGVRLEQLCTACNAEGVDPKHLAYAMRTKEPRWHFPCMECRGKGHHGERTA
jgi:hypothetical protein